MRNTKAMKTLGITQSVCPTCRRTVPAKVLGDETGVHFESFCPDHGPRRRLVHRDMDAYLRLTAFCEAGLGAAVVRR